MTVAPDYGDLPQLLEDRIGQDFDGECHLTEDEARACAAAIRNLVAEREGLRADFIHAANALNSALAGKPVRDADEIISRAALSGRGKA